MDIKKKVYSMVIGMVRGLLPFYLFTFLPLSVSAQCGIENTAFK